MKELTVYEKVCYRTDIPGGWGGWTKWYDTDLSFEEMSEKIKEKTKEQHTRMQVAKFYYADEEMTQEVAWDSGVVFNDGEKEG